MPADQARRAVDSGQATLVCAYDEGKCQKFMFEGAITLKQLEERRGESKALVFYCA